MSGKIGRKLEVLKAELAGLKGLTKANEELGRKITVKVMQVAQPNECDKYKLHVEEIDKITSLLFGLAGRLSRAENTLAVCVDSTEKVNKTLRMCGFTFDSSFMADLICLHNSWNNVLFHRVSFRNNFRTSGINWPISSRRPRS